jgi:ParB family chromosome partitioning protein
VTVTTTVTTLARKPADWFVIESQVRKVFAEDDLRRLGESMRERQLEPVGAMTNRRLLYGERRVRAAKLVGIEVDTLVYAETLTEGEIRVIQLTENIHRADLTAYEQWTGCEELLRLNPQWKSKDLADHLHRDPSSVTRLLSPSKCIPLVQEALRECKLGITDVYAISKLAEAEQAAALAMKLAGASRDQLERMGRKKRTEEPLQARLTRIKCPLPSGQATVVVSGEGLTLTDMIESLSELMRLARKANEEGLDAKTFQAVMRDKAKA